MIKLTTAGNTVGAEKPIIVNIDDILLVQRQTPVDGVDFTAVFFNVPGNPPYKVEEKVDEVWRRVREARALRIAKVPQPNLDSRIACKCGWQGFRSQLLGDACPTCKEIFNPYPRSAI